MRPPRCHMLLAATALFGVCIGNARSQQQQQQHGSAVTMTLGEFEELFSSARLEEAERRSLDQRKRHEAEHARKLAELEEEKERLEAEVTARRRRDELFPDNFQILRHAAAGIFNASSPSAGVERDVATFAVELTLRVMEPRWTVVPMMNTTSMVASNWAVSVQGGEDDEFLPIDPVVNPDVMLLVKEEQQVLATNLSGLFRVTFDIHTRIGKTRSLNALGISSLLYPLSEFSLRIAADASATRSRIRDLSVEPSSAVLQVIPAEEYTDIEATLPLTADSLGIKWLDAEQESSEDAAMPQDKDKADKSKKGSGSQVTASHEVLHTVGEGVIRSTHILDFSTPASEMSALNSAQFIVHGNNMLRVTSVAGHALHSWTVDESGETPSAKLVKVAFKSSNLDSTVTLHVSTEMDLDGSELSTAELPRIECIGVLRQVGHVAVTKEANVEVHEHEITGLTRIDASDVPSQLRLNTDRPIVLGFKYLNPNYEVILEVQEHAQIDTLEATVDRLHYKAQVTETHTIHSMMLIMQSTKLQYLELNGLPSTASMFTVLVNSVPTKPVEGEEGAVLIPLLVGLDTEIANAGGNMKTSVEITYISSHEALGNNGTLPLPPPQLNLPVSILTVHLRLPKTYTYEFSGSFGGKSAENLEYPIPPAFSYITGKRVVRNDHKFTAVDDLPSLTEDTQNTGAVKLVTPRTGRSHYFSRLFVVDSDLALNATYSLPPEEKWWSRLISPKW